MAFTDRLEKGTSLHMIMQLPGPVYLDVCKFAGFKHIEESFVVFQISLNLVF